MAWLKTKMEEMGTTKASAGKRILMLLENSCYPDDVRVHREAVSLVGFGYRVTVIAPRGKRETWREVHDGVHIYRYPRPKEGESGLGYLWEYGVSIFWTFWLTAWVFFRRGFDVIHSHSPPDLYVLIAMCYWPLGKKFVFDHHDISPEMYIARFQGQGNPWIVKALTFFEGLSCSFATHVITVNESYKELVMLRHRIPSDKMTVVRNGPSFDRLYLVEPDAAIVARGQTVLGYVGVMGFQDGIDSLIRALHKLKTELGRNDFYCILIGKGSSLEYLKQLTRELHLEEHILFTGFVSHSDLLKYLSTTDICIAPDPYNPFNDRSTMIKVMEYMTLSKPIVAYRLVEHQVTAQDAALYADVSDELDFARNIVELMDDPALREKMGAAGRKRVEEVLAWPHQEGQLRAAYEKVFSGR